MSSGKFQFSYTSFFFWNAIAEEEAVEEDSCVENPIENDEAARFNQSLFNDFDPFRRLDQIPFSLLGRPRRAASVDRLQWYLAMPKLDPIPENDDFGENIETLFNWDLLLIIENPQKNLNALNIFAQNI